MNLTIHGLAIRKVMARRAEKPMTGSINDLLRRLIKDFNLWIDKEDLFNRWPDAWSYEEFPNPKYPGTIKIYEIEDTHPISLEKLQDYANVWFVLDSLDIGLRLFVYDRYGENERELCLCEYWFMFAQQSHPPPAQARIVKRKLRPRSP